jgi:hypothetical protein
MQISKREFLGLGLRGMALSVFAPLFNPASVFAGGVVVPTAYFNSAVHSYWMRLSYKQKGESRRVRQTVGAALRNIGAVKGSHGGLDFTLSFDKAVVAAFARWAGTRQKPSSLFGLIDMLYTDFIYPEAGPAGGKAMFAILLGMLRGWDGTARGDGVHNLYLVYRNVALRYKDAARPGRDPALAEQLRLERQTALGNWRTAFFSLVDDYAARRLQLNPGTVITNVKITGFRAYSKPDLSATARLQLERRKGQVILRWKGTGVLQQADRVTGPWVNARKASPAEISMTQPSRFFRTISSNGGLP